jgi:HK97 family phage portal protein
MGLLDQLGSAVKAAAGSAASTVAASSVPFSSYGSYGAGGGYGSGYGYNSGYIGPGGIGPGGIGGNGSMQDFNAGVGNLLDNGIVAAVIDAKAQAMASTPPILQRRKGDDWETLPGHPLIDLLQTPNPQYGDTQLWMAIESAEFTTGNGYLRGVWNRSRTQLVQLWWEGMVAPRWDRSCFISGYNLWVEGHAYPLQAAGEQAKRGKREGDCILHFRYALDRRNPRFGWTPLFTVLRQVYGDNAVADYHMSLMDNSAVASMVVVPKEGTAGTLTPRILEELTDAIERKLRKKGAGRVAGTSLPVDVHKMGYSPDEMAITETLGYFERRVCAAGRVHPMVLGLGAGDDFKTYSNFEEAIKDFWQRTIIPTQERRGDELETQLFPLFELDRNEYRLEWDRSKIAALQENEDKLFRRLQNATGGPFMTPNESRSKVNLPPKEGGDELITKAPQPEQGQGFGQGSMSGQPEVDGANKSYIIIQYPTDQPLTPGTTLKILPPIETAADHTAADGTSSSEKQQSLNWNESQHPRDEYGRWASVGSGITLKAVPSEQRAFTGEPIETENKLSKQEKGRLGEEILASWLRTQSALGLDDVKTHYTSNYPLDLLGFKDGKPVGAYECKSGTVDNKKDSQDWRLKIGEPGKAEKALLAAMSPEDKKRHNQQKRADIHTRKYNALAEINQQQGVENVKLRTLAVVIDPDRKVVDVYQFEGVHDFIGWKSDLMKQGYQGSYEYAHRGE